MHMPHRAVGVGRPDGFPVLYFHGWPGSADEVHIFAAEALHQGLCLLGVDRPGYGGTPMQRWRNLDMAAAWYRSVLDAHAWQHCALLANSGGTPFALATAAALGERVSSLVIACGLPPFDPPGVAQVLSGRDRRGISLATRRHSSAKLIMAVVGALVERGWMHLPAHVGPPADRAVLQNRRHWQRLQTAYRVAMRQGGSGPAQDVHLYGRTRHVAWDRIRCPVQVHHGLADSIIRPAAVASITAHLPQAERHLYPDEGHFSLLPNHAAEILASVQAGVVVGSGG